ncbi:MAG: FlgO family outer membrane protein [Desulfobulbaceae bacterium]|nr:FlgO family outer membrane protein [Desulfobulbaceae bacterium]
MKKGMLRLTICCLGLVMLTSVSCASKKPAPELARPVKSPAAVEPAKVAATEQEGYVVDGQAMDTDEGGKATQTARGNVPNVAVNVVQVNKRENAVVAGAEDAEVTEEAADSGKAQTGQKKSAAMVTEVKRVPTKYNVFQYMPDTSKSLGTETLLAEISQEVAGKVYYELKDEGEKNFTAKVAVVNAVPLADLKRETEFGRIMGEYILTDLADRGLQVTELRMGREINILPQTGEFIMSRNIGELANNTPELDYVVISTFTNTRKTLIVQGRLVRLKDGLIKTTWRYGMPLNRELLGLFHTVEAPFKIAVKGMGQ